ncbi:uncharacterized protein LOC116259125 [Nymphaea colorata]|nr:uncharacterized protein LOC116259125 [Nymphaea colorata]
MSGTLPGVHLARRRWASRRHHQQPIGPKPSTWPLDRYAYSPSGLMVSGSSLDENTLRARRSLDEKLRGLKPSSKRGWSIIFRRENKATTPEPSPATCWRETTSCKYGEIFRPAILASQVGSEGDVCSICLDELQLQQPVIHLPCLHRYHAECLRPWLNAHSHCPYCRAHASSDLS